jgi:hypothetical protein
MEIMCRLLEELILGFGLSGAFDQNALVRTFLKTGGMN